MKLRKSLCIILAACLVMSQVPMVALADEIPAEEMTDELSKLGSSTTETAEDAAEKEASGDDIVLTYESDEMIVTMAAPSDAFDDNGELSLSVIPVVDEDADEELADVETDNVAKRMTYDISVLDDGAVIEPSKEVKVTFELKDIPSGADGINIYHHDEEDGIEKIATQELNNAAEQASEIKASAADEVDEATLEDITDEEIIDDVTVETVVDSFSLYTVDFTYKEKTVSIGGDTEKNSLEEIAKQLGIVEEITDAAAYQDADCTKEAVSGDVKNDDGDTLYSVYEEDNAWYVDAVNSFDSEHGLVIKTSDGAEYKIKVTDPAIENYLTFTAEEAGTITFKYYSGSNVQYKLNGGSWTNCKSPQNSTGDSFYLNPTESVSLKGTAVTTSDSYHFTMATGKIIASGDVTSLTNGTGGDATLTSNCYSSMFLNCTSLTAAPTLPSATLASNCYEYMFAGCTSLSSIPSLPASVLPESCYDHMFQNCTDISSLPSLSHLTEVDFLSCYSMFIGCSNLKLYSVGSGDTWSIPGNINVKDDYWNYDMFNSTESFDGAPVPGKTYYTSNVVPVAPEKPVQPSSGESWTSVPSTIGTAAAPINNGSWGNNNGLWSYIVNGESVKNATAWIQYTGADGKVYTGCFYFDKNGNMATGWQKIGDDWYYFNNQAGSSYGIMLSNTTTPDGYIVGPDGKWKK